MIIEVDGVSKSFGDKKVLDGFSLNIESEHSYVITGDKGCGKTTLFRIILGLEKPDSGRVGLLGDYKYPYICAGAVFQNDRLCEGYDAVTNVAMVSKKIFRETVTEELLKFLSQDDIYRPVRELTAAKRRIVAIVRACCIPNDVLIMDEPFTGIDDDTRKKLISFIRDKQGSGPLVIFAADTTDLNFARKLIL